MSHGNARLTVHGRALLVRRVIEDRRPVAHVAKELGVSRQCAHRWVNRFCSEGPTGLVDRSSRPHRCPTRTVAEVEQAVVLARRAHRRGPAWLAEQTGVPARTVSRILARHRVPHLADCDPLTGQQIRATRATTVRYERDRPGELVHMDVKKIGRIPPGGGWRAGGWTLANHQSRVNKTPIGYDYVHALIDDCSRLAYCEILPDEKGPTCAGFLLRGAAYFAGHGIERIERVMTDNAFAYRYSGDLRDVVAALGARQVFIKPHCPWQNGKVERLNRTLATEWAYRQVFTSNDDRAAALAPGSSTTTLEDHTPHTALGGRPPTSRLSPT